MFSYGTSTLTQRALAAAGMLRSFLLLEDDGRVDWEVDQDGEKRDDTQPRRAPLPASRRLKRPPRTRRPGEPSARPQVCLSPVADAPPRHQLVAHCHAPSGEAAARGAVGRGHDGRPPCRRSSSL
jgi:hypothetical protein